MEEDSESSISLLSALVRDADSGQIEGSQSPIAHASQSGQDFFSRLKSYRRWSKPAQVSPWWCSRYGWYCVEKDLLQCVGCRNYLSARLPSPCDDVGQHRRSTDRLRANLGDAHTKTCVWRTSVTGEDVCAPNVNEYEKASADFCDRFRSLLPLFPPGNDEQHGLEFDYQVISEADAAAIIGAVNAPDIDSSTSLDAVICALLGWRMDDNCKEAVSCRFCLRRVGLWLFRQSDAEGSNNAGSTEAPANTIQGTRNRFSPIGQHHRWCPWVMAALSSSALFVDRRDLDGDGFRIIPAWLALLRLLSQRSAANSGSKPLNSEQVLEHYVLARQLLRETLQHVDDLSSEAPAPVDPSVLV